MFSNESNKVQPPKLTCAADFFKWQWHIRGAVYAAGPSPVAITRDFPLGGAAVGLVNNQAEVDAGHIEEGNRALGLNEVQGTFI